MRVRIEKDKAIVRFKSLWEKEYFKSKLMEWQDELDELKVKEETVFGTFTLIRKDNRSSSKDNE